MQYQVAAYLRAFAEGCSGQDAGIEIASHGIPEPANTGNDASRLRSRWLRGLSSEVEASFAVRLIRSTVSRAALGAFFFRGLPVWFASSKWGLALFGRCEVYDRGDRMRQRLSGWHKLRRVTSVSGANGKCRPALDCLLIGVDRK
jgi:hypothetical protein